MSRSGGYPRSIVFWMAIVVVVIAGIAAARPGVARTATSAVASTARAPASAAQRFEDANRAFDRGMAASDEDRETQLRTAADGYRELLYEDGIENGYLHYNLGNAYYALGDIGRAILEYRRAERLIPSDALLAENLDAAIRRRIDADTHGELTRIVRTLSLRNYWIGYRQTASVFGIAFVAFWAWLAIGLFRRPFGYRVVATLLGLVWIAAGAAGVYYVASEASNRDGVLLARESVARKGPGTSYELAYEAPLHAGTEFETIEERAGWWNIRFENGETCWIRADDAEFVVERRNEAPDEAS